MRKVLLFGLPFIVSCNLLPKPNPIPTPPSPQTCEELYTFLKANCTQEPISSECRTAQGLWIEQNCKEPEPPVPSPICSPGQVCGCYHRPPGSDWIKLPDCTVPDPIPVPEFPIPDPPPGTTLKMNNKDYPKGGNGIDSTLLIVGSKDYCTEMGWTDGRSTCAAAQDQDPRRLGRELKWLGKFINKPYACPVWEFSLQTSGSPVIPCVNNQSALASCDHFGNTENRDDPNTPEFEGKPIECKDQKDSFGYFAGFFTIPHSGGVGYARACLPDHTNCGPWIKVKL